MRTERYSGLRALRYMTLSSTHYNINTSLNSEETLGFSDKRCCTRMKVERGKHEMSNSCANSVRKNLKLTFGKLNL